MEEKKKKEEEKRQQEEELERKKMKAKNSFKSFFTKTTSTVPKTLPKAVLKFEPFEIKPDMSVAPLQRIKVSQESLQKLDTQRNSQVDETVLYFEQLQKRKPLSPYKKQRRRKPISKSLPKAIPMETSDKANIPTIELLDDDDDDVNSVSSSVVEIQEDEKKKVSMKAIYLKFHENTRPPYYGTHRKKSKKISPKNPLKKDEALLNYEVDSDDEWEEEEPGESLSDSEPEGDNEEDNEDGDEEEDGWMVPHGYLSDDEGIEQDEEEQDGNSDVKKQQQLAKAKAWEAELTKKYRAKKPVCVGCLWSDDINQVLQRFEACLLVDGPSISISAPSSALDSSEYLTGDATTPDTGCSTAMYVPEEALADLIKVLHGSNDGVDKLVRYFRQYWSDKCNNTETHPILIGKGHISKRQLNKKIRAIAKKESRSMDVRPRWYVLPSILASYGLEGLKTEAETQESYPRASTITSPLTIKPGIKQFTMPVLSCVAETSKPIVRVPLVSANTCRVSNRPAMNFTAGNSDEIQIIEVQSTKPSTVPVVKRRITLQTLTTPVVGNALKERKVDVVSLQASTSSHKDGNQISHAAKTLTMGVVNSTSACQVPMTTAKAGNSLAPPLSFPTVKQSNTTDVKRRATLHTIVSDAPGLTKPGMQKSLDVTDTSSQTSIRRVALQPVVKDVHASQATMTKICGKTKPNPHQCAVQMEPNSRQSSATPAAKRRAVLQTITSGNIGSEESPIVKSAEPADIKANNGKSYTKPLTETVPSSRNCPSEPCSAIIVDKQIHVSDNEKSTESPTMAVKRQAPSPESAIRAAK
ncbi:hypothetical protein QZH41_013615, partial [Actinostola sp. cb2023]